MFINHKILLYSSDTAKLRAYTVDFWILFYLIYFIFLDYSIENTYQKFSEFY